MFGCDQQHQLFRVASVISGVCFAHVIEGSVFIIQCRYTRYNV